MNSPITSYRFSVGGFTCYALYDGDYEGATASSLFNGAPEHELALALERHSADPDRIVLPCTPLLVDTGKALVLLDTGYGTQAQRSDFAKSAGQLASRLTEIRVEPDEIDWVILTHGDTDHIGGTADPHGVMAYRKANHVMTRLEWEHWMTRLEAGALDPATASIVRECLVPLADRLLLIDEAAEILEGITVCPAPGHTPGHAIVRLESEGKRLLYISDLVCHEIHVEHPEWWMSFEHDPFQAAATRRMVFEGIQDTEELVHAFHLRPPGLGRLEPHRSGWRWISVQRA